jgi:hypothetical protein
LTGLRRVFRRHVALPADHGSWAFYVGPLVIGLAAGGRWITPSAYLVVATLAAFLIRQPVTLAVKVLSKRRPRDDLTAAVFWTLVYAAIAAIHVVGLVLRGHGYLLWLALPGAAVFAWYLVLVARRDERGHLALDILAAGVLALCAPAGLWIGVGEPVTIGWLLWALVWAQSTASIVHVKLRLDRRRAKPPPDRSERLRTALPSLGLSTFNLIGVAALSVGRVVSPWLWIPFMVQWAESVVGGVSPAAGVKPKDIGFRQLAVSTAFVVLFVALWR